MTSSSRDLRRINPGESELGGSCVIDLWKEVSIAVVIGERHTWMTVLRLARRRGDPANHTMLSYATIGVTTDKGSWETVHDD